jgi:hypothetical protein
VVKRCQLQPRRATRCRLPIGDYLAQIEAAIWRRTSSSDGLRRGGNDAKAVIKRQRERSCASAPASVKNLRGLDVGPLAIHLDDGQVTAEENEVRIYPVAWKVGYLYAARP